MGFWGWLGLWAIGCGLLGVGYWEWVIGCGVDGRNRYRNRQQISI